MQFARSFPLVSNNLKNEAMHDPNLFSLSRTRSNPPIGEEASSQKFKCIICQSPTLMCCASCKHTFYCSDKHQQIHWKTHQFECAREPVISERSYEGDTTRHISETSNTHIPTEVYKKTENTIREDTEFYDQAVTERKEHVKSRTNVSEPVGPSEKTVNKSYSMGPDEKENIVETYIEERQHKLKEALHYYKNGQYQYAALKAKRIYQISLALVSETEGDDFEQVVLDGILLVKCLLNSNKILNARDILVEVWKIAEENFSDSKIQIEPEIKQTKSKLHVLKNKVSNFAHDDRLSQDQKMAIHQQVKKLTNLFSCFAALFCSMGDFTNSEAAYVKYIKVIENNFGKDSLETSNAYFLIGNFYIENKYYIKAMACMKVALTVRQEYFLGDQHPSIADCYYNIAIMHKKLQEYDEALQFLNKVIKIRRSTLGEASLPVAQALESAANIYYEIESYGEAFKRYEACLTIRQKILPEANHVDILRIHQLVKNLYNKLVQVLTDKHKLSKKTELLMCDKIKTQMEQSPLFVRILPKIKISIEPLSVHQSNIPVSKTSVVASKSESSKYTESPTKLSIKIPPAKPENEKISGSDRNGFIQTRANTQDSTERNIRGLKERQFSNLTAKTASFPSPDRITSQKESICLDFKENNDYVLSLREDMESCNAFDSHRVQLELKNSDSEMTIMRVSEKDRDSLSRTDSMTAQDFYPFRKERTLSSFVFTSQEGIHTNR